MLREFRDKLRLHEMSFLSIAVRNSEVRDDGGELSGERWELRELGSQRLGERYEGSGGRWLKVGRGRKSPGCREREFE